MFRKLRVVIVLAVIFSVMIASAGCLSKTGYWKPGTDFDTIISEDDYAALPADQQAEMVQVTYRELDQKYVEGTETILDTGSGVYKVIKPVIPEPFATGGSILLGLATTLTALLARKKVVTQLVETAQGIQNVIDGKEESLGTSLSKAQSTSTKVAITNLKTSGIVKSTSGEA